MCGLFLINKSAIYDVISWVEILNYTINCMTFRKLYRQISGVGACRLSALWLIYASMIGVTINLDFWYTTYIVLIYIQ